MGAWTVTFGGERGGDHGPMDIGRGLLAFAWLAESEKFPSGVTLLRGDGEGGLNSSREMSSDMRPSERGIGSSVLLNFACADN
jgi:hypothetical protein